MSDSDRDGERVSDTAGRTAETEGGSAPDGSDTAGSSGGVGSPLADAGVETTPPTRYAVPASADADTCADCGRPFPDPDLLALHRGLEHGGDLAAAERERVESARESEDRRLGLFRLRALVVLVVLYFGLLMVYALVL